MLIVADPGGRASFQVPLVAEIVIETALAGVALTSAAAPTRQNAMSFFIFVTILLLASREIYCDSTDRA